MIRKSADLAKATALNEELRSVKENLTGKISVAESALKCKCPCRCGARKSESNITQEEFADMKDLKDLVAKLQSEKDYLKLNLEDQIQKSQKMQIELEVSEERFVRTKAYKSLISQARTLYQNFNIIKKKNEELQKVNDEFNEAKEREINSVIADEEKKISNLYEQISSLNLKIVIIGKEKDEIKFEFEALKNDKSTQRNTEYYVNFIEEIDKEKHALKKKIVDMKREKSDLENKIEDYLAQIMELKDNLHLKDIEVSSLKIRLEDNPNPNNEVDLDTRLKEQRNQILELKQHIKAKDHLISKLEGQVKHLKQDLKSEKKGNESLINEIEVTGNAYEETMKKNKTLTHLLNEKEQNYIQLMNERVKESN